MADSPTESKRLDSAPHNVIASVTSLDDRARWDLYRRLKEEGRLNLLFRCAEPRALRLSNTVIPAQDRSNVLPFITRLDHLAWRAHWRRARWVMLSPPPELRKAILRQDEVYRLADEAWELRHGPIAGGAVLLQFREGG